MVTRIGRGAVLLLAGTVLALTVASCGYPTSAAPRPITGSHIPPSLVVPPTTAPLNPLQADLVPINIYLAGPGPSAPLVTAPRVVAQPVSLFDVVEDLVRGPTAKELADGISTAIPAQTSVLSAPVANNVATVNFSSPFDQVVIDLEVQAVAQVVCTVAQASPNPAIAVRFDINGHPTAVPNASGVLVTQPVTMATYARYCP